MLPPRSWWKLISDNSDDRCYDKANKILECSRHGLKLYANSHATHNAGSSKHTQIACILVLCDLDQRHMRKTSTLTRQTITLQGGTEFQSLRGSARGSDKDVCQLFRWN